MERLYTLGSYFFLVRAKIRLRGVYDTTPRLSPYAQIGVLSHCKHKRGGI